MRHDPARTFGRRAGRITLAGALAGAALTTAVAGTTAPASAAGTTVTPYAFSATGFGTQVLASQPGLRSDRTAYSLIGCTKAAGLDKSNSVAAGDLNGQVSVGPITTHQTTDVTKAGSSVVQSDTRVASVTVGNSALGFKITGLEGVSRAYATKAGVLHAGSTFSFANIVPVGPGSQLPPPLDQGVNAIIAQLKQGPVTVPQLGVLKLGTVAKREGANIARSGSVGLQIHLYGQDKANGGGDDSDVLIGRSYARISKLATYGVFSGGAWGVDGSFGNAVSVGRNPFTPMSCEGTGGNVRTRALASLNLAAQNQLVLGGLQNRVYGAQGTPAHGVTGWSESSVSSLNLGGGQLQLTGVLARAKVVRSSTGHVYKTFVQRIGSITASGQNHAVPAPGQSVTIPNVATIEVPRPTVTAYGVSVTAARITLLGGSAATTVIDLGNAQMAIRRY